MSIFIGFLGGVAAIALIGFIVLLATPTEEEREFDAYWTRNRPSGKYFPQ